MIRIVVLTAALVGCTSVVNFDTPRESGEQCSDGVDNDDNGTMDCEDVGCAAFPGCLDRCGNGTVDAEEACDDGNRLPDDGCGPDCTIDAGCGNGAIDDDEQCDDQNADDTDDCPRTCRVAACGDGFVRAGVETCDDANADDNDGCLSTCAIATCNDGFVQAGVEECDDANVATDDGCNSCVIERCGDGVAQIAPAITSIDFEWLATSCGEPRTIDFAINGRPVLSLLNDDASCNCAPASGARIVTVTDENVIRQVINGINSLAVDHSGADQFLAWAVVTIHTGVLSHEVVVFEGVPGIAVTRPDSLCTGGFDENIPPTLVTPLVPVFEECDDGNANNEDACSNSCLVSG